MKIETSKYILNITESYSTFDKSTYLSALQIIKDLRALPLVKGRVSKDVRIKINAQRRYIKNNFPRMYHVTVFFKRYRHKVAFDMEWTMPIRALVPHRDKYKSPIFNKAGNFANVLQKHIQSVLGNYRKILQENTSLKIILGEYPVKIIGNHTIPTIYKEPGQIRIISLKRKVKDLYTIKTPEKSNRYVGLELEFCAPIEELDLAIKLWEAGVHKFGQMKEDGSLRPKTGERGFELALLLPESHYKRNLKQVCKLLAQIGARADDRRCGLHVHIDMRHRKKDIVYNNLVACQKVLGSFIDPTRQNNEFCRTVESRKFPAKFENTREERYKTINAAAYYKYKTLEIRMHQGSVNFRDISNWMDLLVKICNHKIRIKYDVKGLTELRKRIRLNNRMSEFFQDKACHWQLQGPQRRSVSFTSSRPLADLLDVTDNPVPVPPDGPIRTRNIIG